MNKIITAHGLAKTYGKGPTAVEVLKNVDLAVNAAEKVANRRDKVELSKDAKARLDEEEVDNYRRDTDSAEKARREYSGRYEDGTRLPDEESYKGDGMKKGGAVKSAKFMSFSKKGKPAGMKPVTKMASGGSFRASANGIAQRGKTRGKMV